MTTFKFIFTTNIKNNCTVCSKLFEINTIFF